MCGNCATVSGGHHTHRLSPCDPAAGIQLLVKQSCLQLRTTPFPQVAPANLLARMRTSAHQLVHRGLCKSKRALQATTPAEWQVAFGSRFRELRDVFTARTIGAHSAPPPPSRFSLWGEVQPLRIPYSTWLADVRALVAANVSFEDLATFLLPRTAPAAALLALHVLRAKLAVHAGPDAVMHAREWRCFSASIEASHDPEKQSAGAEAHIRAEIAALAARVRRSGAASSVVTVRRWELGTLMHQAGWRTEDRMLSVRTRPKTCAVLLLWWMA